MTKYFEISGYWKDNKEPFEGYIVKEFDDAEDDFVFEFGWGEEDLKQALNLEESPSDWVLTSYREIEVLGYSEEEIETIIEDKLWKYLI